MMVSVGEGARSRAAHRECPSPKSRTCEWQLASFVEKFGDFGVMRIGVAPLITMAVFV